MSLARRLFNARKGRGDAEVSVEDVQVADDCTWDEEDCDEAIRTAQSLMEVDPDGARQLLAQAQAVQRRLRPSSVRMTLKEPFDPMRMYSDVAKYYHFSDESMEQMHFPKFFGYVREAQLKIEAEKRESDRIRNQGSGATYTPGADGMGIEGFPEARPYQGETVAR